MIIILLLEKLAKEIEGQYQCLEENIEKYKKISVPIEKEI